MQVSLQLQYELGIEKSFWFHLGIFPLQTKKRTSWIVAYSCSLTICIYLLICAVFLAAEIAGCSLNTLCIPST